MSKRAVVIVAPNSFDRITYQAYEHQFQVLTKSGHLATLANLIRLFHAKRSQPRLDQGTKDENPMAGYYLESFLKQRGYEAQVVFDWDEDTSLLAAMQSDPIAVALSTTYITTARMLADFLTAIRRIVGTVPIIVGGPFIWKQKLQLSRLESFRPEEVREYAEFGVELKADCIFANGSEPVLRDAIYIANEFGEYTLLKVLKALESGRGDSDDLLLIPNVVLAKSDGGWAVTPDEIEPVNLDHDYTRWDLVDGMPQFIPLRTSVGCPYRCRYCDFIELHPKVIKRSPQSIVEEIRQAKRRGRNYFTLIDDNIFLTKGRIADLTSTIIQNEIDMIWGGFFRVDRIDESNIGDIYRSGCHFGFCGIESADDGQLERMRKDCKQKEIKRGIELANEAGLHLVLFFIAGYPGETPESIDTTVRFLNKLSTRHRGYSSYLVFPFELLPGTAVDELAFRREYGLRGRHARWAHRTMTAEQAAQVWAPYMFKEISALPYVYYTNDFPVGWSIDRRNAGFRLRRQLTIDFIEGASDEDIQRRFADLFAVIADGQGNSNPPLWTNILADRSLQPGRRMHHAVLAEGKVLGGGSV